MKKAKVPDWVQEQRRRKWRWAGHVMRRDDMRWSYRILRWKPAAQGERSVGRPARRWEDSLKKFAAARGFNWTKVAKDRELWRQLEEKFVTFGE